MAKKVEKINPMVIDRVLMVALLVAATGYILRNSWTAAGFDAAALVLGIIWSFRAVTTNPSKEFRLLAGVVLALISILLAFSLGAAKGLL